MTLLERCQRFSCFLLVIGWLSTIHHQLTVTLNINEKKTKPVKPQLSLFNIHMHMKEQVNNADRSPQLHKNAHLPRGINAGSELQRV